jgi:hypothetical protein
VVYRAVNVLVHVQAVQQHVFQVQLHLVVQQDIVVRMVISVPSAQLEPTHMVTITTMVPQVSHLVCRAHLDRQILPLVHLPVRCKLRVRIILLWRKVAASVNLSPQEIRIPLFPKFIMSMLARRTILSH